jgi:Heterokaryon incompatibility protein (HET)
LNCCPGTVAIQIQLDDDLDSYTALSYAWGVPLKTHLIECGGRSLQINCNLFSALTRLRDEEEQRTLPISEDALIINQSVEPDALQGSEAQVKLMNKVYGVDLGNDVCNANAAFALLTQLAALSPDQGKKVMTQQKGSSEAGLPLLGASSWD